MFACFDQHLVLVLDTLVSCHRSCSLLRSMKDSLPLSLPNGHTVNIFEMTLHWVIHIVVETKLRVMEIIVVIMLPKESYVHHRWADHLWTMHLFHAMALVDIRIDHRLVSSFLACVVASVFQRYFDLKPIVRFLL